ncbi:DNA polymerase IV [Adhaeribacter pallidiroseus]|uniref:DNA polymerase IV n=1 Tax=Adhaeribacter pallidiroseus TaxID=2072847 RepID=A0A369QP54_9BACT|nr:DNA polymerase IV [Adhaeribacter pallidiroseus]RDC64629.1 DNA-directed DNA polymerase [Adhaeribacter pallidiroseus]
MLPENRTIAHFDLDTFFVSVERLRNSQLVGKPVIIGGLSDRGVVASCSYETRRYGVHAGMPIRMAKQLCGEALIMRGDMEAYSKYSADVTQVIAAKADIYEKASIDEHYLDVTGLDRFFGTWKWTNELRNLIMKETGLPISFGLSVNKTVSKIATGQAKPNGTLQVQQEQVKPFLSPLSLRKIPGVGEKNYQLLRNMGVPTIEVLTMIPPDVIRKVLGKEGISIWEKANGIDLAPVVPYSEQKSISTERTFSTDTTDVAYLNNLLVSMVEKLAFELRQQEKLTSCITVKIRYANFDTHTQQMMIPYNAADHILIRKAKELFQKLYNRRMLIRLLGVRLSHLVQGFQQIDLFEDTTELVNLYQAMDKIRHRYGAEAVKRAAGLTGKKL